MALDALLGGVLDGLDRRRYISMIIPHADGTTATVPGEAAGLNPVMVVELTSVTPVADTPPKVTVGEPKKPLPLMVNGVPPATGPAVGAMLPDGGG